MNPMNPMRNQVVEGEPGIFPDPVARVLRALGGFLSRKKQEPAPEPPPDSEPPEPPERPRDGQPPTDSGPPPG